MIKTIDDLLFELNQFPLDTEVRNMFDAGGNFYFPYVKLKAVKNIKGQSVLILSGEKINDFSDDNFKDYVDPL